MRNKWGRRYQTNANNETARAKELRRQEPARMQLIEAGLKAWLRRVTDKLRKESSANALLDTSSGPTTSKYGEGASRLTPLWRTTNCVAVARDLWRTEVTPDMLAAICDADIVEEDVRAVWVSKLTNSVKSIRRHHQLRLGLLVPRQ